MKEKIMQLRKEGYSYKQIVKILGCSIATVSYHCGEGQKEKSKDRAKNLRKTNPIVQKVDRFKRKEAGNGRIISKNPTRKNIHEKVRGFQRRDNSLGGNYLKPNAVLSFTYDDLIEEYKDNQICYLTGRPIDLYDGTTYSLDHIIPASRGGDNSFENLGVACSQANWSKHNMTVPEFIDLCIDVARNFGCTVIGEPNIPTNMKPN